MLDFFDDPLVKFILLLLCLIGAIVGFISISNYLSNNQKLLTLQYAKEKGEVVDVENIELPIDELIIDEARTIEKGWNFVYKNTRVIEVPRIVIVQIILEQIQGEEDKLKFDITGFKDCERYKKGDLFPLIKTTYKYNDKLFYFFTLDEERLK